MSEPAVWRALFTLARPFWRRALLAVGLGAATIGSSVALLGTSAWLIARSAQQPSIADLGVAVVAVRAFGLSRAVFRYLERLVAHTLTFDLLARLRVAFYAAVDPLLTARGGTPHSGDLLSRAVADIETLEGLFARGLGPVAVALVVALGTSAALALLSPPLGLAALPLFALAGLALPWLAWAVARSAGTRAVGARARLTVALVDHIQGMADILAASAADGRLAALDALNGAMRREDRGLAFWNGVQAGFSLWVANAAALALLALAAWRVDGVYLAAVMLMTSAAFEAFAPLPLAAQQLGAQTEAGRRLLAVIEAGKAPTASVTASASDDTGIYVEGLTCSYQGVAVLDNVSFNVRPGQVAAVVGPSGAGKTTLLNALLGLVERDGGRVLVAGVDPHGGAEDAVLSRVAVAPQFVHLFNTTVAENLRIARPDADDDTLREAARRARVDDVILGLPRGYDTVVGEYGLNLSGGERQRLALARALLKDAPCLFADEPTAHLDAATERAVASALLATGRTTIIATHRLETVTGADQILVLEAGRVVERGTHQALLANPGGLYRRLWDLQHDPLLEHAGAASRGA